MANAAPAYIQVHPSYFHPEIILPYNQATQAFELLPSGAPEIRLGEVDKAVYFKRLDVRTRIAVGQSSYNNLPTCEIVPSQISFPTYKQRVRAEYDRDDIASWNAWGVSYPEAQRLAMQQAHHQNLRTALLVGYNPANGEGLLNANGATGTSLPADPNGNTTIGTYDNGALAAFFNGLIAALKQRTYQLGSGRDIVVIGPQRILNVGYNIVQLVQYQRQGAGSRSVKGTIEDVLMDNGDRLIWGYDDTLQGKGAGGADAVIIAMPKIEQSKAAGKINTNIFASLTPGFNDITAQFVDMAAPREIPTPIAGGAIDVISEIRVTSAIGIRPEGITILSANP